MAEPKLTEAQRKVLTMLASQWPEPVTIFDHSDHLRSLREADLIDEWDQWPDGTCRWIMTTAGRETLARAQERS